MSSAPDLIDRQQVVPILRVFSESLAREFYCDYLGFTWEWEHRFEPDLPIYAQVERQGVVLHLSGHHGDASPGGAVMIVVPDVRGLQTSLLAKNHPHSRPGVEDNPWGPTMTVIDPFANRLIFWQRGRPVPTTEKETP
ncbi:glyoxalase superfamily protein [Dermacoccaceae bacterium W4C1]